jgi:SanA protein
MKKILSSALYIFVKSFILLTILLILAIISSNIIIIFSTRNHLFDQIDEIPARKTALVPGTSYHLKGGEPNPWFVNRINAAAMLFHSGKVKYLILSGDNRSMYYNEPEQMRRELVKKNVPDSVLYLDYAGLRTLDSMVRSKEVFGQDSIIVVSQRFHNQRAIFLANAHDINAIGFNAQYPQHSKRSLKVYVREAFARVKVFIDLATNKQPRFLGDKINIGE